MNIEQSTTTGRSSKNKSARAYQWSSIRSKGASQKDFEEPNLQKRRRPDLVPRRVREPHFLFHEVFPLADQRNKSMTQNLSNASAGKTGRSDNKQGEENSEHRKVSGSPQHMRGNDMVEKENPNRTMEVLIMVEKKEVVPELSLTMEVPINIVVEESKSENEQSKQKEKQKELSAKVKQDAGDPSLSGSVPSKQPIKNLVQPKVSEESTVEVVSETSQQQETIQFSTKVVPIQALSNGRQSKQWSKQEKYQQLEYINMGLSMDGDESFMERIATATVPAFAQFRETFSGEEGENIDRFLKRYSAWFKAAKIPPDEKASRLTLQLRGRAAKIIDDMEDEDYEDFDKVKEYLERKFQRNRELDQYAARDAMERVDYEKCGSFRKFMEEISDLVKEAYPTKRGADIEERIYEVAMRRLPVEFGIELSRRSVKDYEGLIRHGPNEEAVRKRLKIYQSRAEQEVHAVRDTEQEEEEQANYAQVRQRTCYKCREPGHIARDCPENDQEPDPYPPYDRPRICYNCRKPGHIARNCPRNYQDDQGHGQRQGDDPRESMQNLANQLANMGFYPQVSYPTQTPYGYQPGQPMLLPTQQVFPQNSVMLMQPQSQQRQGDPSNGQPPEVIRSFVTIVNPARQGAKSLIDEHRPVTRKEHKELIQMGDRVIAKFQQEERRKNADPNLVATIQRYEERQIPGFVPVKERLAVIPVKINGVAFTALFDTGATVSLASQSVADIAGIELRSSDQKVQSITGHIVNLGKKGITRVSIGNHTRLVEIYVVENEQLGLENPYDVILGLSTIMEFPPVTLDVKRRILKINDGVGMEIDLRTKQERLREQEGVSDIKEKAMVASVPDSAELAGLDKMAELILNSSPTRSPNQVQQPQMIPKHGNPKRARGVQRCYSCRQLGHIARDCPIQTREHGQRTPVQRIQEVSRHPQHGERWVVRCEKCDGKGFYVVDPNLRMTFREWELIDKRRVTQINEKRL